jgi:hypothetical protein
MSPKTRAIVSVVFAAAFLATAPVVILLTSGFRYSWKKHRFEKTGIIQVTTVPTGAAVSLNGAPQRQTTPATFTDLLPDDYRVRIERHGYLPWEKTLEVRSGAITFASGVVLFADALPRNVAPGTMSAAAFTRDGGRTAFVRADDGSKEVAVLERGGGTPTVLGRLASSGGGDDALAWSPEGSRLLLTTTDEEGRPTVIQFETGDAPSSRVLHAGAAGDRLSARWSDDGALAVLVAPSGLFAIDARDGTVTPLVFTPGIRDAVILSRTVFLMRTEAAGTLLEKTSVDGGSRETVAALGPGAHRFAEAAGRHLVVADDRTGQMRVIDAGTGRLGEPFAGRAASWEDPGRPERLLVWSDVEIGIVDAERGTHTVLTRVGTPIGGSAWHPNGAVILYSTPSSIIALELDDREHRNAFELVRFTEVGAFAVDEAAGALRFHGAAGNRQGIFERDL